MKRFSEQFKKKSDTIRMRASERADLRDRLVSYMEYHPLPQDMRPVSTRSAKKAGFGIPSEAFRSISINMHYLQGFAGVFAVFLVVGVPLIAERSVPGDMLYPVKTNVTEEVRATLTLSPYAKVAWETQRLERRVAEARLLASEGKLTSETEAEVSKAVQAHSVAAQQGIATMRETDADEAAIAEITFASALEVQSEVLEGHIAKADLATGKVAEEGSSVAALAGAVNAARDEAVVAEGLAVPSYEKLRGHVESETTYAYELFSSVRQSASPEEILDIERRLADVERKIVLAAESHQASAVGPVPEMSAEVAVVPEIVPAATQPEAVGTTTESGSDIPAVATGTPAVVPDEVSTAQEPEVPEVTTYPAEEIDEVQVLRDALKGLRKLITFMTDIDVRETVTIEKLVPVTLTDQERLDAAWENYKQADVHMTEIRQREISQERVVKIADGMQQLETALATAKQALEDGQPATAESAAAQARAFAQDIAVLVADMPLREIESEESTLEIVGSDDSATTSPDTETETENTTTE